MLHSHFSQVPEGEEQPSSDVDLFISTERIKIVSSDNKVQCTAKITTCSGLLETGCKNVVVNKLSKNFSGCQQY